MPLEGARPVEREKDEARPDDARQPPSGRFPGPPRGDRTPAPPPRDTAPEGARLSEPRERERGGLEGAQPASPRSPSFGERAEAVAEGIGYGASEAMPFVGAGIGAVLGTPLGPAGTAGGIAAGAAAGEAGRRFFQDGMGIQSPSDMPEEERPYGYAGEVIGAGAPMATAPHIAAAHGARFAGGRVGNFLNRVIETAQIRGAAFFGFETGALTSAGIAEGVAETVRPGEPGWRIGAGIAAGFLSPSHLTFTGANTATEAVQRGVGSFSSAARQSRAGKVLSEIVEEAGEDPQALARALRETDIPGVNRTAAQMTGSPALQVMEAELSKNSAKFGGESRRRATDALTTMRKSIGALEASGDPQALQEAARVRKQYFETLLSGRIADAERRAVEAAGNITTDSPEARAGLSRRADEIIGDALGDARKVERELWSKLPRERTAAASNTIARANTFARDELLPEEGLPPLIGSFTKRVADEGGETTVGQMEIFRSRMLEKARKADKNADASEARFYGQMAEAALDDLMESAGDEFNDARVFSRTLNETFTQTFAGQAVATGRTGAPRLPPEAMMRRALGSGNELAAMRMRELEDAVKMGSPDALDEMLGIQNRMVRLAASEAVDPETGAVNARKLAQFRRNNSELMERFPGIDSVLSNAGEARRLLDQTTARAGQARKAIEQRAAFARVAGAENPTREVSRILDGRHPQREFEQLARTAQRGRSPEAATGGLRRAVLDDAFQRAGGDTERFSFTSYKRSLTESRRAGQPSALEMMQRNGVIDKYTSGRLRHLLSEAERVEESIRVRPELESLLGNENAMFDLAVRLAGVRVGTASPIAAQTGPGSIVAAGAGSRFMRQVMSKVPAKRTQDVLIEAAENPKFMATLLERAPTQRGKIKVALLAHAYLQQAGLIQAPREAVGDGD